MHGETARLPRANTGRPAAQSAGPAHLPGACTQGGDTRLCFGAQDVLPRGNTTYGRRASQHRWDTVPLVQCYAQYPEAGKMLSPCGEQYLQALRHGRGHLQLVASVRNVPMLFLPLAARDWAPLEPRPPLPGAPHTAASRSAPTRSRLRTAPRGCRAGGAFRPTRGAGPPPRPRPRRSGRARRPLYGC